VQAAFSEGGYLIGAVALAVSALTLVSMVKIWTGAFWGAAPDEPTPGPRRAGLLVPAALMAVGTIVLGVGAQALWSIAERAAEGLVDPAAYASVVAG
jgi:multicomponent Na+:H+ antiporter subunit D